MFKPSLISQNITKCIAKGHVAGWEGKKFSYYYQLLKTIISKGCHPEELALVQCNRCPNTNEIIDYVWSWPMLSTFCSNCDKSAETPNDVMKPCHNWKTNTLNTSKRGKKNAHRQKRNKNINYIIKYTKVHCKRTCRGLGGKKFFILPSISQNNYF